MIRFLTFLAVLLLAAPATAQESQEEERSLFTSFIQNQLSTPNRQIEISGIEGALSSNATIRSITVADREGVWLRVENASIVWSRTALIFRQRLEIETLSAERIEVVRQPLPEEGLPPPESSGFSVPELPIAINLESLEIARAVFGPTVFGLASELSLTGSLSLEGGSLDTALDIQRLDGPGGQLSLDLAYANATEQLDLALTLSEPEDGVVANLLDIEGRPPIDLAVNGSGPLGELDIELTLDADGERVLTGLAQLRERETGLAFGTRLSGPIARLVPARFREFFGEETTLRAAGLAKEEGGLRLDSLTVESAALSLEASAETTEDGFLRRLTLDGEISGGDANPIVLPVPGGDTTVMRTTLELDYGDADDGAWTGSLGVTDLRTSELAVEDIALELDGTAENLDRPNQRRIAFTVTGGATGVSSQDEDVAEALGDTIDLNVSGEWANAEPLRIDEAVVAASALSASLAGTVAEYVFDGEIAVETSSIAPFSGLAGRDLGGALALEAQGSVEPLTGGFDLTLDGEIDELRIDNEAVDNLMAGTTTIAGRIGRDENGLVTDDFRIANDQLSLRADGTYSTGEADFSYEFDLADLALVAPEAEGAVNAEGRAVGSEGLIALTTTVSIPSGSLADRPLREAVLAFEGTTEEGNLTGTLTGDAFLDGVRVQLSTALALLGEERRLQNLEFVAGGARLTGDLIQRADGLIEGTVAIDAADISTAAALAMVEATGAIEAELTLEADTGRQDALAQGTISDFRLGETGVAAAEFTATIENLFGVPAIEGEITASDVSVGGVEIASLEANASRQGEETQFEADARLDNGTTAGTTGTLRPEEGGFRLSLSRLELAQNGLSARLREPASLFVAGQNVTIDNLNLQVADGTVAANGTIADELDLDIEISQLPLSIANTIRPDLELGGVVDATANVSGTRAEPSISFDAAADDVRAALLADIGLSALDAEASGTTDGERLEIEARVTSREGLAATAAGTVLLSDGELDLDVRLEAFPLATLNAMVPDQDLGGTLSGTASIAGTVAEPRATFDLAASGLTAAPLAQAGVGPLAAEASGSFARRTLSLQAVNVSGPQGLQLSASGSVPLEGTGLSVSVSGSAPLSIANRFLIDRGTQVVGTVQLQANVAGSIADPQISGTFSTAGTRVIDPQTNVELRDIDVSARIDGQTITLTSANAALAAGGTISASGTVSLDAGAGFPADIVIVLDEARYSDGELIAATVSGNLAFTGPATGDARLSGVIDIDRAELTIPDNFGGAASLLDVAHRNPPPDVAATLRRARANDGTPTPTARPSVITLDVTVNAPNQIFVRGRGVDAELGGSVRLVGPISAVQPVGAFELIRGRIGILGQRVEFDEGRVTLLGDLDPYLSFVARSGGNDITVFITVEGRVSDLEITFSSQPQLPEDEVLARLIFDRSISELSAFQIAQLAAAAAELAGGGDTSLLGNLREATGLDDLDIVTDDEGNAAVRAGRYVQDNIYLGVEAGAGGSAKATINLDITENLKARGAVGSEDSSVGLFYERDY